MKRIKRILATLLTSGILFSSVVSKAQINVTSGVTPLQLAQALVGPGATVLNPTINGAAPAYGIFTNGNTTNLGIDHGIILTSGTAAVPGSNTSFGFTGANGFPGDPLLSFAGTTYDATRFEFDVVAYDTLLTFNYVFGSDEYTEYVNAGFNDAFGFFISGPGITGQPNIALIPGGTTPVSIDNVNCASAASAYYVCNETGGGALCSATNCPTTTTTEWDGFTTVLTAQQQVMACDTYHLVLVVADVGDGVLDSGVLIANLLAGTASIASVSAQIPGQPNNTIIEGCTQGNLKVKKITAAGPCAVIDTSANCAIDTLCYAVVISGNAIEGVDYQNLPDTICFYPGDTVVDFDIIPIPDGTFEPPYDSIIIDLYPIIDTASIDSGCAGAGLYLPLHAEFYMMDMFLDAGPDQTICIGNPANLNAISNLINYDWIPPPTLSCTNCPNPVATPTVNTTYTVTASLGPCMLTDDVVISVNNPNPVAAGTGGTICVGETFAVSASGTTSYSWAPAGSVANPTGQFTTVNPTVTTTYTVTGTSPCGITTDTVIVHVNPLPVVDAGPDSTVCPNESVQLWASGGVTYSWTGTLLSATNIPNPLSTPLSQFSVYTVTVTDENGCSASANVTLQLFNPPVANAGADIEIFLYDSTQLFGSGGASYLWTPSTGLSDPTSSSPWASPEVTTTYVLVITTADGCVDMDTVVVSVNDEPIVEVPSAFTPDKDGHNDYLKILRRGVFELEEMVIYNRWGEVVFEGHNLSDWWDGTFKGQPADVGVYVYHLKGIGYNNKQIEKEGNITLLR